MNQVNLWTIYYNTYYLLSELKLKNDRADIFLIILQYYIVTVHIQVFV